MAYGILNGGGRAIGWFPIKPDYAEERWKAEPEGWFRINSLAMTLNGAAEKYPTAFHCAKCRKIMIDY